MNTQSNAVVVGIYTRLSRDDGTNNQSVSIENQIAMLKEYAVGRDWAVYDTYIDDGYSGTNFDRPDFKRMIEDIKQKRINAVLVKDLSRFGRNHVGVGMYEEQFREWGVRLVSADNIVDTGEREPDPMFAVSNVFNEYYAQQTSKKTRDAKLVGARQGKCMGGQPPFGYMKDPEDKNHFIPNEDAPIVREIFERIAKGDSARMIACDFNARGVITPSVRQNQNRPMESLFWSTNSIFPIIHNEKYIGHMVQFKQSNISFKNKKRRYAAPDEMIVVENTHEAIIPMELWNAVQKKHHKQANPHVGYKHGISLFAGFAVCADCGHSMSAARSGKGLEKPNILRCARYNSAGKLACSGHIIRWNHLYQLVLTDIQNNIRSAIQDEKAFLQKIQAYLSESDRKWLVNEERRLTTMQNNLIQLDGKLESLYEEKWEKGMPEPIFQKMLTRYTEEKSKLEQDISAAEISIQTTRETTQGAEKLIERMKSCGMVETLTRELLGELIEKIVIHTREKIGKEIRQKVEIHYKFVGPIQGGNSPDSMENNGL